MAQLSGGTVSAIRMDRLDLDELIDGDTIVRSPTTLSLDNGSGRIDTFRGIAFAYGNAETMLLDRLVTGTLFAFNLTAGGETLLEVTRLVLTLKKFLELARAGNDSAALGIAFANDDDMQGTSFDDVLNGYGGHDDLYGGAGADTLRGGAGNDHLYGQSAMGGADGNDSLFGEDGNDYLQGNAGNDTLDGGAGADIALGGQGSDSISGGSGNDSVEGNDGNDTISGGDGNDSLRGGRGNDSIVGGNGVDILIGEAGNDTLTGSAGSDRFNFSGGAPGADVITDFVNGSDKIDLGYRILAVLNGAREGNFSNAAASAQALFNGRAGDGEVAAITVGSDTYLFFSGTGGGTIDSSVRLLSVNATAIDSGDFL